MINPFSIIFYQDVRLEVYISDFVSLIITRIILIITIIKDNEDIAVRHSNI